MIGGLATAIREQGLAETQVTDIVRNARASRATFYRCFDDKDACFVALAEEMLDATLLRVANAVDLQAPAEIQVDQSIDAFLEAIEEDHAVSVTISSDLSSIGVRGVEIRAQSIEKYAGMVFALVRGANVEAELGPLRHMTLEKCIMLIGGVGALVDRAAQQDQDLTEIAPEIKFVVKRVLAPSI